MSATVLWRSPLRAVVANSNPSVGNQRRVGDCAHFLGNNFCNGQPGAVPRAAILRPFRAGIKARVFILQLSGEGLV